MGFINMVFKIKFRKRFYTFFFLCLLVISPFYSTYSQQGNISTLNQAIDSIQENISKALYISEYPFDYKDANLIPYYEYGLKLFEKNQYPKLFQELNINLGLLYLNQLNYPESIFHLSLAALYSSSDSSQRQLMVIYKYQAQAYRFWGYPQYAINQYHNAILNAKKIDAPHSLSVLYREIGYSFFMLEHDSSLYYYKLSNEIAKKTDSNYNLSYNYSQIGDYFHQKAKYKLALKYHDTALKFALKYNSSKKNHQMLMFVYSGLAREFSSLNQIDSAKKYHTIAEEYITGKLSIIFFKEQADFYYEIGDYPKALQMADSTETQSQKLKDDKYSIITNNLYIKIYNKLNNRVQVDEYTQRLISAYDSINKFQKSDIVNSIKLVADIEKIANEKGLLQKEKEIAKINMAETKKRSTIKSIIAIVLMAGLMLIAVLLVKHRRVNRQLNELIIKLQKTHEQLVNSEKLASIGVMAAGIAHEINNPINFVSVGIHSLELDLSDIRQLTDLFSLSKYAHLSLEEKALKFEELQKDINIHQTNQAIKETVHDIKFGVVRTTDIVKSLLNLARMDDKSWVETDLNKSLNDALVILNNKSKHKAELIKNFDKEKNFIFCMPGRINQVFVNIINNAIDAIEKGGLIKIESSSDQLNAYIKISDNGQGMSEESITKAFDPFYTTKDIGKGTGLGLSISYGIIKEHKGIIKIESTINKGTDIMLTLPKHQKSS